MQGVATKMLDCGQGKECPISKSEGPGACIYHEILQNIGIGIMVLDVKKEKVVFSNAFASSVFVMTDPGDYNTLSALLLPNIDECLAGKKSFTRKFKYRGKIYGSTVYRLLEDYLWVFLNDITEKQRLESIAEAVNTMENIGYIFSDIRHEIGNPINSIKMTLSVLKNNFDSYSPEMIKEYIDRVFAEPLRVEYLLKSLKNFTMYENPEASDIAIEPFIGRFISLVSGDFENSGIMLNYNVSPEATTLRADQRMLQQVLLNLLTNASDALRDRDNPEILIRCLKLDDHVVIQVSDTGCGIPAKEQKNIFKPFFTSKKEGTGLGLVIVRKMLASMKGTISIESYENIGTIVTVTLPEGSRESRSLREEKRKTAVS